LGLLNKYSNKGKDTCCKIYKDTFFEHFVKLNEAGTDVDDNYQDNIDFEHSSNNNTFLSANLTIGEVQKIVKKLKKQ